MLEFFKVEKHLKLHHIILLLLLLLLLLNFIIIIIIIIIIITTEIWTADDVTAGFFSGFG